MYDWLVARGDQVLTGDSFFHLSAFGEALPGLNLCGPGRVVCLIDPVGDVYAVPVRDPRELPRRQRPLARRLPGGVAALELFTELRQPQTGGACASCQHYDSCQGGCMAAKFFTGLPLDGPRPGVRAGLRRAGAGRARRLDRDPEVRRRPLPVGTAQLPRARPRPISLTTRPAEVGPDSARPDRACDASPLAVGADSPLTPASARA
jgi:radical SAM protein with 4Fe4S-binding SPASM domain